MRSKLIKLTKLNFLFSLFSVCKLCIDDGALRQVIPIDEMDMIRKFINTVDEEVKKEDGRELGVTVYDLIDVTALIRVGDLAIYCNSNGIGVNIKVLFVLHFREASLADIVFH